MHATGCHDVLARWCFCGRAASRIQLWVQVLLAFVWLMDVDACSSNAQETGSEVQHPLLDQVKTCIAPPDQVASFFRHLLHPHQLMRSAGLEQPWFGLLVGRILNGKGIGTGRLMVVPELKTHFKSQTRLKCSLVWVLLWVTSNSMSDKHQLTGRAPLWRSSVFE